MHPPIIVAVIPAYNPGAVITSVVSEVSKNVDSVILIDDGSDDQNKQYLKECLKLGNIKPVVFPKNKGKGYALIAGIEEALRLNPDYILTIDSDGQHNPGEIKKFKDLISNQSQSYDLVIGTRKKKANMPFRSELGNTFMSKLVGIVFDEPIEDTQSGFRMLSSGFAKQIISRVPPGRYETEMKILIDALENNLNVASIEVETIYFENNKDSKFRPLRDSILVMTSFVKYAVAGIISFLIDYTVFIVLSYFLGIYYLAAHFIARTLSGTCNYLLNKHKVFKSKTKSGTEKVRYILAVLFSLGTTSLLLYCMVEFIGFSPVFAKPLAECAMFILNFLIVGKFVFRYRSSTKSSLKLP